MRTRNKRWYQVPCVGALIVALGLQLTYVPRSEALIGLIFKSRIVKTIGGIGAIGGGAVTGIGLISAGSAGNVGSLIVGAGLAYWGLILGGIGIIILDENKVADIEFRSIDVARPQDYVGFSRSDVEIYNSEVELLNAVRQRIMKEVGEEGDTADAERLWMKYEHYMSPETFAIAKAKAKKFVEAL